jgi:hypothetical protein
MNPNCHLPILAFHENRTSICSSFPVLSVVDGVTSPEGRSAAWLYDLLNPHVNRWWSAIRGRTLY